MANANASRICHLLDIYDRHHGDEMNEEKGTRCNELMVLGKYLEVLEEHSNVLAKVLACTCKVHGSRYGRIGRRIKPCVQITGTWTVDVPAVSVHGPSM